MATWQDRMGAKGYTRYPLPISPYLLPYLNVLIWRWQARRPPAKSRSDLNDSPSPQGSRADRSGLYFHYTPIFDATDGNGPMRAGAGISTSHRTGRAWAWFAMCEVMQWCLLSIELYTAQSSAAVQWSTAQYSTIQQWCNDQAPKNLRSLKA